MEKLCLQNMHLTPLLLLLAALLTLSHGVQPPHGENHHANHHSKGLVPQEKSARLKIIPSNTDFALKFYHLITSQKPKENAFFSPLSISAAIAMLSLGAGSFTRTQMLQALAFNLTELSEADIHQGFKDLLRTLNLPSNSSCTNMGSALFLSDGLQPQQKFLEDTKEFYESRIFQVNFKDTDGTTKLINDHVSNGTQGKITNLVSGLSENTLMVLINYIYFQAQWAIGFDAQRTKLEDFHVNETTTVQVPMMVESNEEKWYLQDNQVPCSVLRLDYQDDAKVLLILPDPGKMEEVEAALTPQVLEKWKHSLQMRADLSTIFLKQYHRTVRLHLPKFSISASYQLDEILLPLGFTELFSPQANFSGISKQQNMMLTQGFHKAKLEVDEKGTTAAAATGFTVGFKMAVLDTTPILIFNRPFIIIIYSSNSDDIIFMGKVVNPTIS